ncbi:MAG: CBS domain-containing protein [Deltaproteobacteria bacterium]|jgi:acetoin utilization protein AcuB|nr:CBS domain-containing protein [Deltaproteobacteria bacterium]
MFVKDYMTHNPVTVTPDRSISEVRDLLRNKGFRHVPVVDADGRLLGVVTDRDIRSAFPSFLASNEESKGQWERIARTPVEAIMSTNVVSLTGDATLDDALLILDKKKVGAVPVVNEDKRVVGVFSIRDLMRAYSQLFGLAEKGSVLIVLKNRNEIDSLSRILQALEAHNILCTRVVRPIASAYIYLRVQTFNLHAVYAILRQAGFEPVIGAGISQEG